MRADRANRTFVAAAALAGLGQLVLGLTGCGALMLAAHRLLLDGAGGVDAGLGVAVAMGLLSLGVAGRGLHSVHRQLVATERLARQVRDRQLEPSGPLETAAASMKIGRRIDLVDAEPAFAFTYGFLQPRVVLSRGLVDRSTPAELRAILEHESYHAQNLDPLKLVAVRAASDAFFFLPAIRQLTTSYLLDRELAADRRALTRAGTQPLTAALMTVLSPTHGFEAPVAAALGGSEQLSARVEQLESGREPPPADLNRTAITVSAAALAAIAVGALVVRVSMIDSMPAMMGPGMSAGSTMAPVAMVGMLVPIGVWTWVGWRVARWIRVRPRPPARHRSS